jgi:hypothetical protein
MFLDQKRQQNKRDDNNNHCHQTHSHPIDSKLSSEIHQTYGESF